MNKYKIKYLIPKLTEQYYQNGTLTAVQINMYYKPRKPWCFLFLGKHVLQK